LKKKRERDIGKIRAKCSITTNQKNDKNRYVFTLYVSLFFLMEDCGLIWAAARGWMGVAVSESATNCSLESNLFN